VNAPLAGGQRDRSGRSGVLRNGLAGKAGAVNGAYLAEGRGHATGTQDASLPLPGAPQVRPHALPPPKPPRLILVT
jgi:hypothetical protein